MPAPGEALVDHPLGLVEGEAQPVPRWHQQAGGDLAVLGLEDDEERRRRPWMEMVGRLMAACDLSAASAQVRRALVLGAVGDGAGLEFLTWLDELDLPVPGLQGGHHIWGSFR